jgi:seryl-tRNA synthetase
MTRITGVFSTQEVNLSVPIKKLDEDLETIQLELNMRSLSLANIPHESVPAEVGEDDNVELRTWGEPSNLD